MAPRPVVILDAIYGLLPADFYFVTNTFRWPPNYTATSPRSPVRTRTAVSTG